MKNSWIINAILAVIAAVMAIMQEIWISTPLTVLEAFVFGSVIGACLSACGEWAKILPKWINYDEYSWMNVGIGTGFGILAALITALAVCG